MRTKIFKICISIALTAVIASVFCVQAEAQYIWKREMDAAKNMIWEEKLTKDISFLSDTICKGRATGTRGSVEAARWITERFKRTGMYRFGDTYIKHVWTGKGVVGHNVLGMVPGSLKSPCSRYIVIGAHYDHIGELDGKVYPGADSNASGVVAMTSLAEMFTVLRMLGKSLGHSIIFVAFDAKELNMAGSQSLWRMLQEGDLVDPISGRKITADMVDLMVNIDLIGSTLSPLNKDRKDYIIMLGEHTLPRSRRGVLEECNSKYGMGMDIGLSYYGSENFTKIFYSLSDQKIFAEHGVPAVMFTSGITMNTNKTRDTAASLDMEILRKRIYLMFHWIETML